MDTDALLTQYFAGMWPHLDEHARRLVAASPNTVHLMILIRLETSTRRVRWRFRGRSG